MPADDQADLVGDAATAEIDEDLDPMVHLVHDLLKRSRAGNVTWEAVDEYSFVVNTKAGAVLVTTKDQDGAHPFIVVLSNGDGLEIDRLSSGWELDANGREDTEAPLDHNDDFEALYHDARIRALKINEVIEGIIAELDDGRA